MPGAYCRPHAGYPLRRQPSGHRAGSGGHTGITPGIISTARGYVLEQPDQPAGCTREFKVRHTPDRTGQELNLIVDCGGQVKNISISHRVYGRITAEMDIRSRQDVREFLQSFEDSSSTVLSTATDGYHYHLVEAATPDRLSLIEKN